MKQRLHDSIQCLAMFEAAQRAEIGVVVKTNASTSRARAALQQFRKESAHKEFYKLHIRYSPDDPQNDLWIIKNRNETNETNDESDGDEA